MMTADSQFDTAVSQIQAAEVRPEIVIADMATPQRIATHAHAVSGDVNVDDTDLGTGRFVLLHEPDGNQTWGGTMRCVVFARAEIEHEMAADPALPSVAWTWLTEGLDRLGATYDFIAGTITVVKSDSFGQMETEETSSQLELRASWTPQSALGGHVAAWADSLCTLSGLPQLAPGVVSIERKRSNR